MSLIHIARRQSLGSFSEKEVEEGIASQRFLPEDFYWTSGMKEWQRLSKMKAFGKRDASLLNKEEVPLIALPELIEPAWERRSELGFFKALIQTILQVLFSPSKTFSTLKRTGGLGTPFLFYSITHIVVIPLACLSQNPIIKSFSAFMPQLLADPKIEKILNSNSISFSQMTAVSLKMILYLFLTAILLHLSLKVFKNTTARFETTFRMLCYLNGACAVVTILLELAILIAGNLGSISAGIKISLYAIEALVGSCIGGILYFIALKKVYHLSSGRTILVSLFAMLLPLFAILAVGLLLAILVGGGLAAKYLRH